MNSSKNYLPITIISILFFIFGFITWLNSMLIPYLKAVCELTDFQSLFVTFSFYIAYTVMALPSAYILQKTGFKRGMTIGLLTMAVGSLLFIPAATSRTYILFLSGLFIMGSGLALLQTATNPYVTIIGPRETAARRISIMGICNKLAGTIAPIALAFFLVKDGDQILQNLYQLSPDEKAQTLDLLAMRAIVPYIIITISLAVLGIALRFSPLPEIEHDDETDEERELVSGKTSVLQFPHLIIGTIALFFYVGAEVIPVDTLASYGQKLGFDISQAKSFPSYTLTAMIIGYVLGIVLMPKYLSQRSMLITSAVLGVVFTTGALLTEGIASIYCLALLGLANAMIWPTIWPLSILNLGNFIKQGSALLIMAIAGGAILPLVWGKISDLASPHAAYAILIPLYLFILYFAVWGYKKKSW